MSCPRELYWKIPEGVLIFDSKNWLKIMAKYKGFSKYFISNKCRLGNLNSRTISYTLTDPDDKSQSQVIVVKEAAKNKGVKWGRLGPWTPPIRHLKRIQSIKVHSMFRTEYSDYRISSFRQEDTHY
jgi:hypothetical protein